MSVKHLSDSCNVIGRMHLLSVIRLGNSFRVICLNHPLSVKHLRYSLTVIGRIHPLNVKRHNNSFRLIRQPFLNVEGLVKLQTVVTFGFSVLGSQKFGYRFGLFFGILPNFLIFFFKEVGKNLEKRLKFLKNLKTFKNST